MYDANANGVLERADIDALALGYVAALGLDAEAAELIATRELEFWDNICRRCEPEDGKVSPEQFMLAVERWMAQPGEFIVWFWVWTQQTFELLDHDEDGRIDMEEFVGLAYGERHRASSEAAFAALDLDGSGYLCLTEVQRHQLDYWLSDDPAAPGNQFWGPLD